MKFKNSVFFLFIAFTVALLLLIDSCKKPDNDIPNNPYDTISRKDTTAFGIPLDSLTITYVHKKLFVAKCALPGCHDGHFEPDYRTPQSSFSTLVYAPIIKNNIAATFKYRVIPFDTTYSVLYERITNCCFVTSNDRMPQDDIGIALPDSSLNLIAAWIMNGARDMFGNIAKLPNNEPVLEYYAAFDTISLVPPFATPSEYYSDNRLDGIDYNPFIVPINKSVFYIAVKVTDDSTAEGSLLVNKLKISLNADNFSSALQYNGTYVNLGGQSLWIMTIHTNNLPPNDTLYMRYYVNDGDHTTNSEFPRTEQVFPYKSYSAFIRQ